MSRVWLSNGTFVIEMSFRRDIAEVAFRLLSEQDTVDMGDSFLHLRVKKFTVQSDGRKYLTPLKRLTASASAEVDVRRATVQDLAQISSAAMDELVHYAVRAAKARRSLLL